MKCFTCGSTRGVFEDGRFTCLACGDESHIGEPVAEVHKRNGAWWIELETNHVTEDLGWVEMTNAAGTIKLAKRLAEGMVERAGFSEPYVWERESSDRFALYGTIPQEDSE